MLPEIHGLWSPAVDMYETSDSVMVFIELPGLSADDVQLSVGVGSLSISGFKPSPVSGCTVESIEIHTGNFARELKIPGRIDRTSITASMKNGLLRVVLPKLKQEKVVVPIDPE